MCAMYRWRGREEGKEREGERWNLKMDVLTESELWMVFLTQSPLKIRFSPLVVSLPFSSDPLEPWQATSTSSFHICLSILYQDSVRCMMPYTMSECSWLLPKLPTDLSLYFINHPLADIMSFCTTWIIIPGIMVLCGKYKFSSVQLLSAIRNQNCWLVQNKRQKGRPLWHKNTHCRTGSHQSLVMNCSLTEDVCRMVH